MDLSNKDYTQIKFSPYGSFEKKDKNIINNTLSVSQPLLHNIHHDSLPNQLVKIDSKESIEINVDNYLSNRDTWDASDNIILTNKLREIRAYKKLYTMAKLYYGKWYVIVSLTSMIFVGIIPLISTASILTNLSSFVVNIVNIVCGILSVVVHVISQILDYKTIQISSAKIATTCTELEDEIETILNVPFQDRTKPVYAIKSIDNISLNMVTSCTSINLSSNLINEYTKEIKDEIKKKQLSEKEYDELLNIYLIPTGDTIIEL
jgi:hypothetical protein